MPPRAIPTGPSSTRITVLQGQARVSAGPQFEFTTVLGSCIATCLFDPDVAVGGMNHFLLGEPAGGSKTTVDEHYGVFLMEVLINEMLAQGAAKSRMRAHIYGGANLHAGMARIGTMNAEFARSFLAAEGIALVREGLGGSCARRVDFRPATGQVRCRSVPSAAPPDQSPPLRAPIIGGEVEMF